MAQHGCRSGPERCSRNFPGRIRRAANLSRVVVCVGFRLYVAFSSIGWTHPCPWWTLHLSADTTPLARTRSSLRSPKGPPDERAWDAGSLHSAPITARRACYLCAPTRVVLPRVHDRSGSALPSVRLHVRNVAICWIMRSPRKQRSSDWHVPAATSQPWCLAYVRRSADLCLCWPGYGDTLSFPQLVSPHKRASRQLTRSRLPYTAVASQ